MLYRAVLRGAPPETRDKALKEIPFTDWKLLRNEVFCSKANHRFGLLVLFVDVGVMCSLQILPTLHANHPNVMRVQSVVFDDRRQLALVGSLCV